MIRTMNKFCIHFFACIECIYNIKPECSPFKDKYAVSIYLIQAVRDNR